MECVNAVTYSIRILYFESKQRVSGNSLTSTMLVGFPY